MKKKRWFLFFVILVLCAGSVAHDRRTSRYSLSGVSDALRTENLIYLIDNSNDSYHLFAIDETGTVSGHIKLPKLDGTWWNAYSSLTVDGDGQVYVYCYGKSMISAKRRSLVYRCDFQKGKMEQIFLLPDDLMLHIQVIEGEVYYAAKDSENRTGFYKKAPDREAERLLSLDINPLKLKSHYYKPGYGLLWADWNRQFYDNEEKINGTDGDRRDYVNISAGNDGIVFTDMGRKTVDRIVWEGGEREELYRMEDVELLTKGLEYQDILPLHYEEDGSLAAGINIDGERRILGLFDEEGKQTAQFFTVKKAISDRMREAVFLICAELLAFYLIMLLLKALLKRTKGTIPILYKLICILIPLVVLSGLLLQVRIEKSLEKRIMKMDFDLLYSMADQRLSALDPAVLKSINLQNVPEDEAYRQLFRGEDHCTLSKVIYSYKENLSEPIVANTYQWLFWMEDGDLRYLEVDGNHYYGSRVAYDRSRGEMEKMKQAMEEQHVVKTEYNDFTGDFVALYIPVIDEDGRSVGVMESGLNRRILTYEIKQQMEQIHRLLVLLAAVLIGGLFTVLGFFLRPLSAVKKAVEEVSQDNLGAEVKVWGRDEVAGIAAAFNRMSARLKEQVEFIRRCSDGYAAFVPEQIFEILDRDDITQVTLGDQKEISAAVLRVGSSQFKNMAKSMTGGELYRMINDMLKEMIPCVGSENGIVDHMSEDGLTAYYPEGSRSALMSAVLICEKMNRLKEQGRPVPLYRAAIHSGTIRLGIVGQEERMEASTVSEVMTLAGFLQEIGEKYGVRILVTESAAAGIKDFKERFHVRFLGYLYIRMTESLEGLYDVYDGDEEMAWRTKEETADLFRDAFSDYLAERYYDARLKFAKILRRNPKDLAARTYIYRCDKYYQSEEREKMKVWLDEY